MIPRRFLLVGWLLGGCPSSAEGPDAGGGRDGSSLDAGGPADGTDASVDEIACVVPDSDGDGHDAAACGGDDCDDDDPSAWRALPAPEGAGIWSFETVPGIEVPAEEWYDVTAARGGDGHLMVVVEGSVELGLRLSYALGDTGSWQVGAIEDGALDPCVVAGPDGVVHLAFLRTPSGEVVHSSWDGSSWQSEGVLADVSGSSPGLAVDSTGAAWICARVDHADTATCATNGSGTWVTEPMPPGWLGRRAAMGADGAGRLHVATILEGSPATLGLAVRDADGWTVEDTGLETEVDQEVSLAVSAGGAVHALALVSFPEVRQSHVALFDDGMTVEATTEGRAPAMVYYGLALDPWGRPRAIGRSIEYGEPLAVGVRVEGRWVSQRISANGVLYGALLFDPEGAVDLFYREAGTLQHAWASGLVGGCVGD